MLDKAKKVPVRFFNHNAIRTRNLIGDIWMQTAKFYICFFQKEILSLYCGIEMHCNARRTLRISDLKIGKSPEHIDT